MPGNIKGITVEIGGNTTGLDKALSESNKSSKDLQAELKLVQKQLNFDPTNTEMLAQKQELLSKAVEAAASKLRTLKEVQSQVEAQYKNGEIGEEAYRAFQREVAAAENALRKAEDAVEEFNKEQTKSVSSTDKLKSSIQKQETELAALKKKYTDVVLEQGKNSTEARTLKNQIDNLNGELSENKTALKEAEDAADDYGDEIEESGEKADKAGKLFDGMKSVVTAASAAVTATVTAIAVAVTGLAGAFVDMSREAAVYADNMATISAQTGVSTDTLQAYSYAAELVDVSLDTLTGSMTKQLTSMRSYKDVVKEATVDATKFQAAQTKVANATLSVESAQIKYNEVLKKSGEGSAEAKQAAINLEKAQNNLAQANSELASASQAVEPNINEITKAYNRLEVKVTDTNGKLRDSETVYWEVIDALKTVEDDTERDALAMTLLGKSAQDLNPLIKLGAEGLKELTDEAYEAGAVLSKESLNGLLEVSDNMERMNSSISAAKNNIGLIAADAMSAYYSGVTDIVQNFTSAVAEAYEKGDIADETVKKLSDSIVGAFENVASGIPQITNTVMLVVNAVISSLQSALPEVVSIVTSFVPEFVGAVSGLFPALLSAADDVIDVLSSSLTAALPDLINTATSALLSVISGIVRSVIPQVLTAGSHITLSLVSGIAQAAPDLLSAVFDLVTMVADTVANNIPFILDAVIAIIDGVVSAIIDSALPAIGNILNTILPKLISAILSKVPSLLALVGKIVPQLVSAILNTLPMIISAVIAILNAVVGEFPAIVDSLVTLIPLIVTGLLTAIFAELPQIINALMMLVTQVVAMLPDIINPLIEQAPMLVLLLAGAILSCLPQLLQCGIELTLAILSGIISTSGEMIRTIVRVITGWFKSIGDNLSGRMLDMGRNIITGLWDGIKSMGPWLLTKLSGFADDVVNIVKGLFGIHSPSTLFRDEIGRNLARGIGEGFDDEMPEINDDILNSIPTDYDIALRSADSHARAGESAAVFDVTIPLSLDGNVVTKVVSRIQYSKATGKARVVGVKS